MRTFSKIVLGLIGLITLLSFSCKETRSIPDANQGKKIIFLGYYSPQKVDDPKAGVVMVGFLQSARPFTLNLKIPKAHKYIDLLKLALKDNLPLKVYVFENSTEIAELQKAPAEIVKAFKKSIF
ncbi:hypothetical protein DBR43_06450 [Pedobacter sp. KBW06]|uniref:hypothetical protein n=1 Tax=Pedobacter sp. KBW06 TaxID=2153359 RepID=UPI000F5B0732|nr:hypothetical protein [Pedobacter sp. KBW06]RQO75011.1 hypothetical protein DBR43_06450 [Pedobacter sp. KBW06]